MGALASGLGVPHGEDVAGELAPSSPLISYQSPAEACLTALTEAPGAAMAQ